MRIAVMGAGSIGGYFGGMLSLGGNEVTLIARGAHLEAIRDKGLQIITDYGQFTVQCEATDDPRQVEPVDLILLTVKTYHNEQAVPAMQSMVGEYTTVLCLQNGIDSYEAAARFLGAGQVLPGAAYIESSLESPGVVKQTGDVVEIVFGEPDGVDSPRGELITETLTKAGTPAQLSDNIQKTLWTKFLFIATMAGVTALSRETMAQLMPRPEWRQVILGCMAEIETVGRASGVDLDADIVQSTVDYIEGSLDQMHASMHADIMAGRPLELEALNGAVVRAGQTSGSLTPINDVIYAALKPFVSGSRA
jgi:2-dehydropantoate 2-reductase